MKFVFKNINRSEFIKEVAQDRVTDLLNKYPDLGNHELSVTFSMDNSPRQKGPDSFAVKILMRGRKFKNLILEKRDSNLYGALAKALGSLSEKISKGLTKNKDKYKRSSRRQMLVIH
jgi:ribosome-associated translation inhibitor RaiA